MCDGHLECGGREDLASSLTKMVTETVDAEISANSGECTIEFEEVKCVLCVF